VGTLNRLRKQFPILGTFRFFCSEVNKFSIELAHIGSLRYQLNVTFSLRQEWAALPSEHYMHRIHQDVNIYMSLCTVHLVLKNERKTEAKHYM